MGARIVLIARSKSRGKVTLARLHEKAPDLAPERSRFEVFGTGRGLGFIEPELDGQVGQRDACALGLDGLGFIEPEDCRRVDSQEGCEDRGLLDGAVHRDVSGIEFQVERRGAGCRVVIPSP